MPQTEAQRKAKQKYDAKNYKTIGIKCPIEEYNLITSIAKNNNQTTSMFSRECLEYYLKNNYIDDILLLNNIPKKLFDLRQQNNFSPSFVAEQFNMQRELYDKYENGTNPITLEIILKACKLYDVPQSYFGINSDLVAVGNKGYTIKNMDTSETMEVTDEEFKMLKGVLESYRNK